MTPEQKTVIDTLIFILVRREGYVPLPHEDYLTLSLDAIELDSIDRLDLVMELEQRFDLVFTTSAISNCLTIDEMVEVIRREMSDDPESRIGVA